MQQSKFGLGSKGEERGSSMKISIVPFLRAFYARMIYSFLIHIYFCGARLLTSFIVVIVNEVVYI